MFGLWALIYLHPEVNFVEPIGLLQILMTPIFMMLYKLLDNNLLFLHTYVFQEQLQINDKKNAVYIKSRYVSWKIEAR
jgi:hypothetical protein